MIVVYAPGGGLGHRVRAQRVIDALHIDARIIANDEIPRELEGDVAAHRAWIRTLGAKRLIVDTFPCGIQGELSGLDVPMDFIARLLRWDEYQRVVGDVVWPRFETTFIVEKLTSEHERFVQTHSERIENLTLPVPVHAPAPAPGFPYWLIVHSGPDAEVSELVEYTDELRKIEHSTAHVLVASPCRVELPASFERIDANPAFPLFANAERIISAAGFNVMLETEPYRDKHVVVPFPRRFDDQFARAARRRIHSPS
jgi:hypothetical protein